MPTRSQTARTIHDCRDTIRALVVENTALRTSGAAFGELAERLSQQLRVERTQWHPLAEQNHDAPAGERGRGARYSGELAWNRPSFVWEAEPAAELRDGAVSTMGSGARAIHLLFDDFVTTHQEEIVTRTAARMAARETPSLAPEAHAVSVSRLLKDVIDAWISDVTADADVAERFVPAHSLLRQMPWSDAVSVYADLCHVMRELTSEEGSPAMLADARNLERYLDIGIARAVVELGRQPARSSRLEQFELERSGFRAHELRNLLNTAMLAVEAVRQPHTDCRGAAWGVLDRSLDGLKTLVVRSLDAVRARRATLAPCAVRLSDLVADVAAEATLEATARGVTLTVESIAPDLAVLADREVLGAVVSNLLQNALKFTRPATVVTLRVEASDRLVCIHIQDECGGLPGGDEETLFHSFEQLSPDRTGLGLGLAFCRWGTEANNGRIDVHDIPGVGCVFTVELPRVLWAPPPDRLRAKDLCRQ
jgi:signal transduction histidine kinase